MTNDPMAEALASLSPPVGVRPRERPYRTKKGAIKFQPESDWSIDRLPEIESEFQQTTGQPLPVRVRGQGAIHNKWNYAHENSADIGLSPNSKEGQALMAQLERQGVPFLAFDRAIPGVSTGKHIHIGRASRRLGQEQENRPATPAAVDDPMAEALREIGASQQQPSRPARPTQRAQPTRPFTPAGPFQRVSPEQQEMLRSAVDRIETRRARGPLSGITAGVKGEIVERPRIPVPDINQILTQAREAGQPRSFGEDRAQRQALQQRDQQATAELRQRIEATPDLYGQEYKNFLLMNRAADSDRMKAQFVDLKIKQSTQKGDAASVIARQDAERARKARLAQMGTAERFAQVPKSVVAGLAGGVGTSLKGVAALARKVNIGGEYDGKETTDLATYQLGEAITQLGRDNPIFKSNPDLEQEFIVGKAPETVGQIAQFMLGGWATKSPKLAVTILGSGMTAGDAYDEVRANGGTDDEAVNSALLAGGLLGPTELIGMRGAMKAISGTAREATMKATMKAALREGRRDAIENALQEVGQEFGQGIITKNPRSLAQLAEAGTLGAIGGSVTVPLTAAANRPARRAGRSEMPALPAVAPEVTETAQPSGNCNQKPRQPIQWPTPWPK